MGVSLLEENTCKGSVIYLITVKLQCPCFWMSLCVIECRLRLYNLLNGHTGVITASSFLSLPSISFSFLVISPHPPSSSSLTRHLSPTHTLQLSLSLSLESLIANLLLSVSLPCSDVEPHPVLVDYTEQAELHYSCHKSSSSPSGFLCCRSLTGAATNILSHHIVKHILTRVLSII